MTAIDFDVRGADQESRSQEAIAVCNSRVDANFGRLLFSFPKSPALRAEWSAGLFPPLEWISSSDLSSESPDGGLSLLSLEQKANDNTYSESDAE